MGRIAIVDDSEDVLDMFPYMLRDGHQFETFSNAVDFLKTFRPGKFDLVMLDVMMPRIDGFEVLRRVQRVDKQLPVVAVSARAFPQDREKALEAGFCDYFVKPILDIDAFRTGIYSHIGGCSKLGQRASAPRRATQK